MKRNERARRFGFWTLSAAFLFGGCGGNSAPTDENDGVATAVASTEAKTETATGGEANETSFPLATVGESGGERRVFTVDGVEFAFRWAPPGRFLQGSPKTEEGRDSYEIQREVELTRGFWILETETTQEMWRAVRGENPSKFLGDRRPVDSVGIAEIAEFCAALSERVGATAGVFALPTEAQWEYAARAGASGPYPAATLEEIAWFGDENDGGTRDVATKKPNAWGLYDVCGNLWEWCADRFGDYPVDGEGRGLPATDPTGATPEECPGNIRVDRGGCWDSEARECRVAYRGFYDADRKGPYVGFRFVCVPTDETSGR